MKNTLLILLLISSLTSYSQTKASFMKFNGFGGEISIVSYTNKTGNVDDIRGLVRSPTALYDQDESLIFNTDSSFTWHSQKGIYSLFRIDSSQFKNTKWIHNFQFGIKSIEGTRMSFSTQINTTISNDTLFNNSDLLIKEKVEVFEQISYVDNYKSVSFDVAYLAFRKQKSLSFGTGLKLETEISYKSEFRFLNIIDTMTSRFYVITSDTLLNGVNKLSKESIVYRPSAINNPVFIRASIPLILNVELPKIGENPSHINFYLYTNLGLEFYLNKGKNKWINPYFGLGLGLNLMIQ